MLIYSVIMFLVAAMFLIFAVLVYRGHTSLIHSYHQSKVAEKDKPAYGRAVSKTLFGISAALIISGIVGLLGDSGEIAIIAVVLLFVGFIPPIILFIRSQKKYNGGIW